jgi:hypothetical protein
MMSLRAKDLGWGWSLDRIGVHVDSLSKGLLHFDRARPIHQQLAALYFWLSLHFFLIANYFNISLYALFAFGSPDPKFIVIVILWELKPGTAWG